MADLDPGDRSLPGGHAVPLQRRAAGESPRRSRTGHVLPPAGRRGRLCGPAHRVGPRADRPRDLLRRGGLCLRGGTAAANLGHLDRGLPRGPRGAPARPSAVAGTDPLEFAGGQSGSPRLAGWSASARFRHIDHPGGRRRRGRLESATVSAAVDHPVPAGNVTLGDQPDSGGRFDVGAAIGNCRTSGVPLAAGVDFVGPRPGGARRPPGMAQPPHGSPLAHPRLRNSGPAAGSHPGSTRFPLGTLRVAGAQTVPCGWPTRVVAARGRAAAAGRGADRGDSTNPPARRDWARLSGAGADSQRDGSGGDSRLDRLGTAGLGHSGTVAWALVARPALAVEFGPVVPPGRDQPLAAREPARAVGIPAHRPAGRRHLAVAASHRPGRLVARP